MHSECNDRLIGEKVVALDLQSWSLPSPLPAPARTKPPTRTSKKVLRLRNRALSLSAEDRKPLARIIPIMQDP